MDAWTLPLLLYYLAVIVVICVYGLHRYWMVVLFLRHRKGQWAREPAASFRQLPRVTVQLPMYNEARVAARIIRAACALDYPRDRLQIQVLDDSTDQSDEVARACCREMAAAGHDVEYLHRQHREGYKAGALDEGLKSATGEFIAVFDADFVPPPDLLRRMIHHFTDERIGMVQARWDHLNRDQSLLTRIQAIYLDGHFVIEQTARAGSGRWFNFNGTAGVWRRTCIEEAGGWQHDTLTEDTDLSYRAQLGGWQFRYLPQVTCPAEIPPTMSAFLNQQHRWNKGLAQTAIKLLPRILRSDAPLRTRIEAFFHLTCPVIYVAILLLALLVAPAMLLAQALDRPLASIAPWLALSSLALGTIAAATFCIVSQAAQGRGIIGTLLRLPALMAIGIGVSVMNTRAILEAVLALQTPFVRTPKYAGAAEAPADPILQSRRRRLPGGLLELLLALAMAACLVAALRVPHTLMGVPFLALFAWGFAAIGLPALRDDFRRAARAA